ncbi:MAG: hypothetical protein Sv326_0804 [Candidatus Fermentimicrarchaeum limneticum]|uniref:PABS domain-containing protein n=1 Tax=Fermentimicrarchaeum limneticum TaxID=2795018 RepID=A0A7D6BCB7_FERL1|nr:MAG: hypothetical protein Sv326_0804 [Candidatus Fermentimicrarchaeum limneticum]
MAREDSPLLENYISAFVAGAAVMVLEIIATRILEPFLTNSIFTWIGVLSVMLISLSLGYFLGGRIADRNPRYTYIGWIFVLSAVSVALIPLFSYDVLNFSASFGIMYGPFVASAILFSVPSILLAMVSPYLVKRSSKKLSRLGEVSGNIYAVSTVGSIAGTLLTGYVIIPNMGVKAAIFSLSIVLAANGALFLGRKGLLLVAACLLLNYAVPQPANFKSSAKNAVVYETYSPYQYLRVIDRADGTRTLSTGVGGQTQIFLNSTNLTSTYTQYQELVYLLKPDARKALFIGLGGGAMPRNMHERTDADITIVEIDPAVVQIAKDFFNFSEDARMRVETGDGRFFLSKSKETYDYIVVDAYIIPLPPFHLTTYEFVEELRKHLNPGGIVFVNIGSALEGSRSGMFKAIFSTYRSQFKNVYVFPSDDSNYSRSTNIVLLATDVDYGTKEKFVERISNLTNNSETISFASSYYDRPVYLSSEPILTDDFCPIEMIGISSLNRK